MRVPARRTVLCFLAAALAGIFPTHAKTSEPAPRVTISTGVLEGLPANGEPGGATFLGIPFAAAPVGNLRWEPPQRAPAWSGTRKATQFAAACPQLPARWLAYPAWSEDCLYLNVWTPRLSSPARLPVIVYFHGGSNATGYSQVTPVGPALSALGVVVVTANYRLGPFGFFAHPALTAASPHHASGDYGILDQIQALRWVKENIASFGGDPRRVTAMGQSSGSFDICLMMASPPARGLFQKAIMESGDCESSLMTDIRKPIEINQVDGSAEGFGKLLAADLGVADGPDTIQKLRRISAADILHAWSLHPELEFDAAVDGWVIPDQPMRIFAAGRQMRIPVLTGSNADEGTVLPPGPTTVSAWWKVLRSDTGRWAEEEFRLWPAGSDAEVHEQYLKWESAEFAFGAWTLARAMAAVRQPAYLYLFTWKDAGARARLGAHHGEELNLMCNNLPPDWTYVDGQKRFSEILRQYWTNFAKSGKPDGDGLPSWPAYNPRSNQVMELGSRIGPAPAWTSLPALQKLMQRTASQGAN